MTIAGGIMGALFHRERTGEATTVDVSLLGTGMWSMGAALALSLQLGMPWAPPPKGGSPSGNPLVGNYRTKDGRYVVLCCLQPGKYWAEAVRAASAGRSWPTTSASPTPPSILANGDAGYALLAAAFAERTLDEWREALADFSGPVGDRAEHPRGRRRPAVGRQRLRQRLRDVRGRALPAGHRPGAVRRGARAGPAGPRSSTSTATPSSRASAIDWDTIVDLKVRGVVA